jgi:hypothetical protein
MDGLSLCFYCLFVFVTFIGEAEIHIAWDRKVEEREGEGEGRQDVESG